MEKIGKAIGLCIFLYVLVMVLGWINTNHPMARTVQPQSLDTPKCSITAEEADGMSEVDLYNTRAKIMRLCDSINIPDISQATLDCEAAITAQYPAEPTPAQTREMYQRQHDACPGEPPMHGPQGEPYYWH